MKFLHAIIHLHDAFTLGRIKTLEIDFTKSDVFIILGSNGSGKSSLLQLLVNWPDDSSRYAAGGYKKVSLIDNGSNYVLLCQYNGQDKYCLIKDDTVIYKGSHGQMFNAAVEQHLGLSKLYKSLLLENAQVTKMNSSQRSQWLMDLSGIDYTWALNLYDKLKSKRNMYSGSAKVSAQRLAQMTQEYSNAGDHEVLKKRHKVLMDSVSVMHSVRVPDTIDIHEAQSNLQNYTDKFKHILTRLNSTMYTNIHTDSIESVQSVLERLKTISTELRIKINDKHNTIQNCKSIIGEQSNISVSDMQSFCDEQNILIDQLLNTCSITNIDKQDLLIAARAYKDYTNLNSWFKGFSSDLKDLGTLYQPDEYKASIESLNKSQSRLNELNSAYDRISSRIEHYESHLSSGSVECPNCKHSFISGYNKVDHESSKDKLKTVVSMLEQHKPIVAKAKEVMTLSESKKELWYVWSKFVNDYSYMGKWLNVVMNRYIGSGIDLISSWERLGIEIQTLIEVQSKIEKVDQYKVKIDALKAKDEVLIQDACTRMQLAQAEMIGLSKCNQSVINTISRFENKLAKIKGYDFLKTEIKEYFDHSKVLVNEVDEVHRKHYFNHALQNMQSELATVEFEIKKIDQSSAMMEGVKVNLEQDKMLSLCWGVLAKAMSPKDGIIGKSLVSFLSEFFTDINDFIAQVWTYELSVVPIELGEEGQFDVDYNFKLIQDNKTLRDISLGSEAMKYVVDLAFRLSALLRVKEKSIAMLDEPFTSLDQSHRSQATFAMRSLIESDLFDQLFIISHHSEFIDAFSSASVICLDPRNVSVPSTANACVKILSY